MSFLQYYYFILVTCPIRRIYVLNYTRQVETYVLSCTRVLYWKSVVYKWGLCDYDALTHSRCIQSRPILFQHVVYPMITCSRTVFRHSCPIRSIYVLNYIRQVETYVLSCIRIFYWKNMGYKWGFYENGASVPIRCKKIFLSVIP